MKFIWFKGDLGNQVFSCAFYNYLKKKFPHEKIYGCMKTSVPIVVNKYFDLELPESYKYLDNLLFVIFRISKKLASMRMPSVFPKRRGRVIKVTSADFVCSSLAIKPVLSI